MGQRLELHQLLLEFADYVYFQPPNNVQLEYPCIIYQRDFADTKFANNSPYSHELRYMITIIDPNPDSEIPSKIAALPKSLFNRFYVADNLNHDVYNVYF